MAEGDIGDAMRKVGRKTLNSLKDIGPLFHSLLYENNNPTVENAITQVETKTNISRDKFVYIGGALLGAYMIFGALAEIVCNFIGFAYPAYASVKAIRTKEKDDDTHWLTYWTVFAAFSLLDFFAEYIMKYFPVYYVLKALFLLYLYLPQTYGAQCLYDSVVDPAITKLDTLIAAYRRDPNGRRFPPPGYMAVVRRYPESGTVEINVTRIRKSVLPDDKKNASVVASHFAYPTSSVRNS